MFFFRALVGLDTTDDFGKACVVGVLWNLFEVGCGGVQY